MTSLVFAGGSRGKAGLWREDLASGLRVGAVQLCPPPPSTVPESLPPVPDGSGWEADTRAHTWVFL